MNVYVCYSKRFFFSHAVSIWTTFFSFLDWTLKKENNLIFYIFVKQWKFFELIFVKASSIVAEVKE